jgi:microcystin-dependent protein
MPQGRWLTPDTPSTGYICRRLLIPHGIDFLAIVTGCLLQLTYPYYFEKFGDLTPVETSDLFRDMLEKFTFDSEGGCRMIGEIIPFAGATSPRVDWLVCDGSSLARADYPDLFTVIGTTYGSIDDDHFNVPDIQGRTVIGVGTGSGLTERVLGDSGGEETHVLTVSELASHGHTDTGHVHSEGTATPTLINGGLEAPASSAFPSVGFTGSGSANLSDTGDDNAHNTMQPFLALNYLIVAL